MSLTSDAVFSYAYAYARRAESAGRGTQYPTVAQAARRFRVLQAEIVDAVESYDGREYMALATFHTEEETPIGEHLIEAYLETSSDPA